jgi:hypothetical protein
LERAVSSRGRPHVADIERLTRDTCELDVM